MLKLIIIESIVLFIKNKPSGLTSGRFHYYYYYTTTKPF